MIRYSLLTIQKPKESKNNMGEELVRKQIQKCVGVSMQILHEISKQILGCGWSGGGGARGGGGGHIPY